MTCESRMIGEFPLGNIFLRPHSLPPGAKVPEHRHHFDHVSFTFVPVNVRRKWPDGTVDERTFAPGEFFLVDKDCLHEITALRFTLAQRVVRRLSVMVGLATPPVFFCIYAHRNAQGEVVQEYAGWAKGHLAVKEGRR